MLEDRCCNLPTVIQCSMHELAHRILYCVTLVWIFFLISVWSVATVKWICSSPPPFLYIYICFCLYMRIVFVHVHTCTHTCARAYTHTHTECCKSISFIICLSECKCTEILVYIQCVSTVNYLLTSSWLSSELKLGTSKRKVQGCSSIYWSFQGSQQQWGLLYEQWHCFFQCV